MTQSEKRDTQPSQDVALIVGGGPGISSSCARLFAESGMRVGIAARNPDKPVLREPGEDARRAPIRVRCERTGSRGVAVPECRPGPRGARRSSCTTSTAGLPAFLRKAITEADPGMVLDTLRNAAFSAFLVGQQAARLMRENTPNASGTKGTIIFTNASAALKGFPSSGAFAMACHAKSGLAQSMARELMPQGIHVANVPIDAAIGWTTGGRNPRAQARGSGRRRQHGRPGLHRGSVSAAPSPASVYVGVRSRAATVGREMVMDQPSILSEAFLCPDHFGRPSSTSTTRCP